MEPKLLELHFSQLQSEWNSSKYNSYSDVRKKKYHDNLTTIINRLEAEDFSILDEDQIQQRFWVISFVFKSLEFLNHSTTSTIPYELVYVLELAMKDWVPENEYIIVTALINGVNGFSFDSFMTFFEYVYKVIDLLYNVKFDHRLVQINVPESTSRDYLANVVLYHELGHFVEKKHAITRVIYEEFIKALRSGLSDTDKKDLFRYFPYLELPENIDELEGKYDAYNTFALHISEYFCDLFASQYIHDCSNSYLEYITQNTSIPSPTHPITPSRVLFINTYLDGKDGYVLKEYKRIIKEITKLNIEKRFEDFTSNNFENLLPAEVTNPKQLHSLFIYGWKVWLGNWETLAKMAGIDFKMNSFNVYDIVNNLIEKSIGNYIVTKEWKDAKGIIA